MGIKKFLRKDTLTDPITGDKIKKRPSTEKEENIIFLLNDVDTIDYIKLSFDSRERVSKSELPYFRDKKTILGNKFSVGKFIVINVVNECSLNPTSVFVSISPRYLMFNEIKSFVDKYSLIKKSKAHPTFIDKKLLNKKTNIKRLRQEY